VAQRSALPCAPKRRRDKPCVRVLDAALARYLSFFNTVRPHTAHSGKTPDSAYYASLPVIANAA